MTLEYDNVSCVYDADGALPLKALDSVSLTIRKGEFIGLIGHTGSGKSTLIQHANGLIRPTSGRILADGEDIWGDGYNRLKLRAKVGLVFQYPEHQLFEADILSDVCYGPKNLGLSEEEAKKLARNAMEQVGLSSEFEPQSPFALSGGQKRRVAIAGVLAMSPEILILDEPTAGLDPRGRDEILSLVKTLNERDGITIVLVSHSMEDVARFADRLLVVNGGRLIYDDTPDKVFAHRDELLSMGLKPPESLELMHILKDMGLLADELAMPADASATADLIMRLIGGRL